MMRRPALNRVLRGIRHFSGCPSFRGGTFCRPSAAGPPENTRGEGGGDGSPPWCSFHSLHHARCSDSLAAVSAFETPWDGSQFLAAATKLECPSSTLECKPLATAMAKRVRAPLARGSAKHWSSRWARCTLRASLETIWTLSAEARLSRQRTNARDSSILLALRAAPSLTWVR